MLPELASRVRSATPARSSMVRVSVLLCVTATAFACQSRPAPGGRSVTCSNDVATVRPPAENGLRKGRLYSHPGRPSRFFLLSLA